MSAFQQAGGKLIIYQGWADEKISPFGTVDYYHAVVHHAGGFAASQDFSRLYMIQCHLAKVDLEDDGSPLTAIDPA